MSKRSVEQRQIKRAATIERYAKKRADLKRQSIDISLSPKERMEAMRALQKLPRDASPVRSKRRCLLTGRPRGNYRRFGLSRHMIRLLAMEGLLPGVWKSSW